MAQKTITELQLRDEVSDTLNFPSDDAIQSYRVTGAQIAEFIKPMVYEPGLLKNVGLAVSAAAGAMTVALKQRNGSSDPTTGKLNSEIAFRSATLTSGASSVVAFEAALSLVIPSTATLGYANGEDARVFVYAIYDGTNKELAVSTRLLDERLLHNTTAIDTDADFDGIYSTNARTNCAVRCIGEFVCSAIAAAGTWVTPSRVDLNCGQIVFDQTPTGTLEPWIFATIKRGWLALDGQTIGSPASGADFARNEAEALFTLFWNDYDNTALPIQDSAGSPTTRGASAAADFAANKRLPIFNADGLVARGTGTQAINARNKVGPSVGAKQEDQIQNHAHTLNANGTNASSATDFLSSGGSAGSTHTGPTNGANAAIGGAGTPRTGTETRVSAFGVQWIIKL